MKYQGVECKRLSVRTKKKEKFYAVIPLKVLDQLGNNSDKAKILTLLYCYGRMNFGKWFTLSNVVVRRYNIQPRQKRRLLSSFEKEGLIRLKKEPGKSHRIQLIHE